MSDDLVRQMEQDFEEKFASNLEKADGGALKTVAELARIIKGKEMEVADLERQFKESKKELLRLTDEELPASMAEMGLASFTLDDGSTIDVKPTYGASILVANREKAYDWLRDHGYDDIIKNNVAVSFGRGEDDMAGAFKSLAEKEGYSAQQDTSIHSQTLRAFVRERIEAGDEFPMDLFGAYVGQRAVIKGAKNG
jgi:hypothetical protein